MTTRRLATPLGHDAAAAAIDRLARLTVVAVDKEFVRGSPRLTQAALINHWDALVVRAARLGACERLLTGDLNHGQVIDGVRIQNPFRDLAGGPGGPSASG